MKVNENGRNVLIFGRSFTSRSRNLDVLALIGDVNYGRLDVIQNPEANELLLFDTRSFIQMYGIITMTAFSSYHLLINAIVKQMSTASNTSSTSY